MECSKVRNGYSIFHLFIYDSTEDTRNTYACEVYDAVLNSESTASHTRWWFWRCHFDCADNHDCAAYSLSRYGWSCTQYNGPLSLVLTSLDTNVEDAVYVKKSALPGAVIHRINVVNAEGNGHNLSLLKVRMISR